MKKEQIVEAAKKTAEKTATWCKTMPAKCSCLCQEAKKNSKQLIVAAVILVVALLLLSLVTCEHKAPEKPTAPEKPAAVAPIAKTAPKPQEPAEVIVPEAPKAEEANAEVQTPEEPKELAEEQKEAELPVKEVIEVEPTNAVLTFTATAEKDFNYQVFYTVEREVWFDGSLIVTQPGQAGTHSYSIVLPAKEVFRIRLDFDEEPGTVTIKDIYLTGSQSADLNDFSAYELNQMENTTINEDGSLTFTSTDRDPFMAYRPALLPE